MEATPSQAKCDPRDDVLLNLLRAAVDGHRARLEHGRADARLVASPAFVRTRNDAGRIVEAVDGTHPAPAERVERQFSDTLLKFGSAHLQARGHCRCIPTRRLSRQYAQNRVFEGPQLDLRRRKAPPE